MSASVYAHPTWVKNWGAGDVERSLNFRGFTTRPTENPNVVEIVEVFPVQRTELDRIESLFKPNPQRKR